MGRHKAGWKVMKIRVLNSEGTGTDQVFDLDCNKKHIKKITLRNKKRNLSHVFIKEYVKHNLFANVPPPKELVTKIKEEPPFPKEISKDDLPTNTPTQETNNPILNGQIQQPEKENDMNLFFDLSILNDGAEGN